MFTEPALTSILKIVALEMHRNIFTYGSITILDFTLPELIEWIRENSDNQIALIKKIREASGLSLRESKIIADNINSFNQLNLSERLQTR